MNRIIKNAGDKEKPDEKQIIHDYFSRMGRIGGRKSRGGGRKAIPDEEMTDEQKKNRKYNERAKQRKVNQN